MHNENTIDATSQEAPLFVQAEDTLNRIRESLMNRAATIEGETKRLNDEYNNVMSVLNRIAPPAPAAHPITASSVNISGTPSLPRKW